MADDKVQIIIDVNAKEAQAAIEKFGTASSKVISDVSKQWSYLGGVTDGKQVVEGTTKAASGFSKLASSATGMVSAVALVAGGFALLKSAINGAVEEAKLTRQIEASLLATDEASKQAVDSVLEFADALELTTGVNDDLVKSTYVTAKSFGVTSEQAKKLTQAAIDLAAATGVDVETAVRQLGGTVDGTIGKIANLGADFRNLTEAQLKSGAAIDLVASKFGGSAAKAVDSYEGRVNGLTNSWEDFTKAIGRVVIESGLLQSTLQATTSIVDRLANALTPKKDTEENIQNVSGLISALGGDAEAAYISVYKMQQQLALNDIDIGKTSQEVSKGFQSILDSSVGATKATADFEDRLKSLIPNETVKKIEMTGKALEDFNKKAKESAEAGDKFKSGILGSFGDQTATEANKASQAILSVDKALKDGIINTKTAYDFRLLIAKDFNDKQSKQQKAADDKEISDAKRKASELADIVKKQLDRDAAVFANPLLVEFQFKVDNLVSDNIIEQFNNIDWEASGREFSNAAAGVLNKTINFAAQGREGSKKAVIGVAGAAGTALLGPQLGAMVESIVALLANGKVAGAFVKEFIKGIPDVILAIAEALPEVLAAIVETIFTPEFLYRLGIAMGKAFIAVATLGLTTFAPEWGRKVGEEISKYVDFSAAAEKFSAVFAEIGAFFTGFAESIQSVFDPIIEPIERLIKAFDSASGQGGGQGKARDIGGQIAEGFKSTFPAIAEASLPFSKGGIVPLYAAAGAFVPRGTDTVPAMLTPGERVLSVGTTGNLDSFMSSQSVGQEQTMAVLSAILGALQAPMVVNAEAKVNQSAFADIILQLNRQNMRLTA